LVAPDREREKLSRIGQALEALDRDEDVRMIELAPQGGREVEIIGLAARCRPDFEDDGNHCDLHPPEKMFIIVTGCSIKNDHAAYCPPALQCRKPTVDPVEADAV